MKDMFPRTPAEFATHGRHVVLYCANGHRRFVKPENVIQRLGPDFDLFDGFAELSGIFVCDQCGAENPEVSFFHERPWRYLTSEEALLEALEFRAFVHVRDALVHPGMRSEQGGGGRRRRFGGRQRR